MSTPSIKPGDTVRWTQTSRRSRVISMTLREGTVESITDNIATVRYGKKGRKDIHLTHLSVGKQPTNIDRVISAIREANQ